VLIVFAKNKIPYLTHLIFHISGMFNPAEKNVFGGKVVAKIVLSYPLRK
jgi:hypothetical protein